MSFQYEDILSKPKFHREAVGKVARYIRNHHPNLKMLACRGSSGAAVAYPVAYKLGLEVCHVRKDGERSHSGERAGNPPEGRSYVIIDDFTSQGSTIRDILGECGPRSCQAIVLYMEFYDNKERKFAYLDIASKDNPKDKMYKIPMISFAGSDYKCATESCGSHDDGQ